MIQKPKETARALLFERLVDLNPESQIEPHPLRTLDAEELKESVRREVERLLNTRCPLSADLYERKRDLTVIDYGVPDFSQFNSQSSDLRKRLAAIFSQAISAFEPRLRQVRVLVEDSMDNEKSLLAHVDAMLVVESINEPLSFPVVIGNF